MNQKIKYSNNNSIGGNHNKNESSMQTTNPSSILNTKRDAAKAINGGYSRLILHRESI